MVVAPEYPRANTLAVEPAPGKWGQEFTQNRGELGYFSAVAVNTGDGVLTKAGGVGGGTGVKYRWGNYHYLFVVSQCQPRGVLVTRKLHSTSTASGYEQLRVLLESALSR